LRWVDIWAPWDPVPNGPLDLDYPYVGVDGSEPLPGVQGSGFLPCRVANDHQPWRDHVTYRTNAEEVVLRWIGEIVFRATDGTTAPENIEPFHASDANATPVKRRQRMTIGQCLLSMQALVIAAGVVTVMARWNEIDDLGRRVRRDLPGPLRTFVGT